jgi:prepilin-type processing-associated H-X9-DG protein
MFLLKYFTKKEYTNTPGLRLIEFQGTPLFGCPAVDRPDFDASTSSAEFNSGYGMVPYATYAPDKYFGTNSGPPPGSAYKGSHWAFISQASGDLNGRFYKRNHWLQPAEHGIIADSKSWFLEVRSPGTAPNTAVPPQPKKGAMGYDPNAIDQFDRYRHGKRPDRIAFNILYCDGHVASVSDVKQGYIAMRRHWPG